ncbi:tyrosinase family oxidase copper chaperone [Streptomyces sp. NPDC051133]|uniref:tyrosinase family oxidase copper chaperone n=1 Tax=Streptomyces sp. NPDC051133 TaxID=3155521 RepID=UPI00342A2AC9
MRHLSRRSLLRASALLLAGASLGEARTVTAAAAPVASAQRSSPAHRADNVPEPFDEMYLGRHIQGWPVHEHPHGMAHASHHNGMAVPQDDSPHLIDFVVRVDDADLHTMQNADSTWISVLDHYTKHRTPHDLARAAVRELNGASLVPIAA